MAAMVNMNLNNMLNVKDSRWLQLEVCREYQRSKCSRSDTECKFAHPPPSVEVQNGRVVACYDSIKGRCNREKPPCKYFHPPQHLKDQLLINGRNHLALKNALMLQMGMSPGQHILPGQMQTIPTSCASSIGGFAHHHVVPMQAAAPYLAAAGIPQLTAQSAYSPYAASPAMLQVVGPEGVSSMMGYAPAPATKLQRSDRIETYPGMVQGYKRSAGDKSGLPVYQPSAAAAGASAAAAAYHQAQAQAIMQLQQPFVPVSFAGHPPGMPRF